MSERLRDKSYRPDCPACDAERIHTAEERMRFHSDAGHGCVDGRYTRPDLDPKNAENLQ